MFSSSKVNFYTILSHVLNSDSEILKMIFFFFFFYLTSSHHLKGYFSKFYKKNHGKHCYKNFGRVWQTISVLAEANNGTK